VSHDWNGSISVSGRVDVADLDRLVEIMPDATLCVDGGTIQAVNAAAERLFGYTRDELIGEAVERLVPGRLRGAHVRHRGRYARRPYHRPMGTALPLFGLRRDGTEFPAEISLSTVSVGPRTLVITAVRDITERLVAESVAGEESHRRAIAEAMLEAEHVERDRIATALHDDTIQVMTAVLITLDRVVRAPDDADVRRTASTARDTLRDATERTRRLMFELRPAVLHEQGIRAAVVPLIRDTAAEIGAEYEVDIGDQRLPRPTEELVYRTVREALANVRKHSRASRVQVVVSSGSDHVTGSVADNGRGFRSRPQPASAGGGALDRHHIGLDTMTERVRMAGGTIDVDSRPGEGTTVSFRAPIARRG
jgi:PAS domain S-box-containing protein